MPRLAGQREDYLVAEMRAYRDDKRNGGDTIMAAALYGVSRRGHQGARPLPFAAQRPELPAR